MSKTGFLWTVVSVVVVELGILFIACPDRQIPPGTPRPYSSRFWAGCTLARVSLPPVGIKKMRASVSSIRSSPILNLVLFRTQRKYARYVNPAGLRNLIVPRFYPQPNIGVISILETTTKWFGSCLSSSVMVYLLYTADNSRKYTRMTRVC